MDGERIIEERVTATRFAGTDRKSTRLNSSHVSISYAVFCLKKKKKKKYNNAKPKIYNISYSYIKKSKLYVRLMVTVVFMVFPLQELCFREVRTAVPSFIDNQ